MTPWVAYGDGAQSTRIELVDVANAVRFTGAPESPTATSHHVTSSTKNRCTLSFNGQHCQHLSSREKITRKELSYRYYSRTINTSSHSGEGGDSGSSFYSRSFHDTLI